MLILEILMMVCMAISMGLNIVCFWKNWVYRHDSCLCVECYILHEESCTTNHYVNQYVVLWISLRTDESILFGDYGP